MAKYVPNLPRIVLNTLNGQRFYGHFYMLHDVLF